MIKIGRYQRTSFFMALLLGLMTPQFAFAKVSVTATVDRNEVSPGEAFTLQVAVESDESKQMDEPSLPVINNVALLHTWVSSQSKSSVVSTGQGIDFKTIRSKVFNYQFSPSNEGKVLIEPITVSVDGKAYTTQPITIAVTQSGGANPRAQAQRGQPSRRPMDPRWEEDPIDDLEERFNQLLNRQFGGGGLPGMPGGGQGGFMTQPRNANEAFMILAEVDKTTAFKGEQITAAWYLYTTGRVRDIDTLKYPSLQGFWKEDIQISTQLNFEPVVVNGVQYNRALLASYALFPIEVGKAVIDPYQAKATIIGGFGFGQGFQATKSSENIPIMIKPLPEAGKPEDFTGAVGEFQMIVDAPNKSIVAHQPFPLKVRFEGRGNAKLIELPKLPIGNDLEVYDIKNEAQFFKNGQSFKEFEVQLIPRQEGELVIGELNASFFDPKKEQYVTLNSKPIRLTVLPGSKQASIGEERVEAESEQLTLPKIATQWNPDYRIHTSKLYIWLFIFGLVVLGLLTKLVIDLGLFNKKPSLEEVINLRFKKIDKLLEKDQLRKLGIEVTNTVYEVMGEISGEGGANEELDKILAKTAPSVRREIETPLRKLMDFFGVLGFGPKTFVDGFKDIKDVKAKTKELKKLLLKAYQLNQGNGRLENVEA